MKHLDLIKKTFKKNNTFPNIKKSSLNNSEVENFLIVIISNTHTFTTYPVGGGSLTVITQNFFFL